MPQCGESNATDITPTVVHHYTENKICKLQSISHAWHTPYVATDFTGIPVTFTSHISW